MTYVSSTHSRSRSTLLRPSHCPDLAIPIQRLQFQHSDYMIQGRWPLGRGRRPPRPARSPCPPCFVRANPTTSTTPAALPALLHTPPPNSSYHLLAAALLSIWPPNHAHHPCCPRPPQSHPIPSHPPCSPSPPRPASRHRLNSPRRCIMPPGPILHPPGAILPAHPRCHVS